VLGIRVSELERSVIDAMAWHSSHSFVFSSGSVGNAGGWLQLDDYIPPTRRHQNIKPRHAPTSHLTHFMPSERKKLSYIRYV